LLLTPLLSIVCLAALGDSPKLRAGQSGEDGPRTDIQRTTPVVQLEELAAARDRKLISDADYEAKKAELLERI